MGYKTLFILVEGPDDDRFSNHIITPKLREKYDLVEVRQYAGWNLQKLDSFLKSIRAMGDDYVYLADINNAPCISSKKHAIKDKLKNIDEVRIAVVIREIESWYLAGLDTADCANLRIRTIKTTDAMNKEQFNNLIPKRFNSRIDFMIEVLKCFSVEIAKSKNKSFNYFAQKHNL